MASGMVTAGLRIVLSSDILWLIRRAHLLRQQQEWSQTGRLELTAVMSGEKNLKPLANSILVFLARYVDAHVGTVFAARKGCVVRKVRFGSSMPVTGCVFAQQDES